MINNLLRDINGGGGSGGEAEAVAVTVATAKWQRQTGNSLPLLVLLDLI